MTAGTFLALLLPGLATGVGGAAVLALRRPSTRLLDALLGLTAGIMLAAVAFSLLVPALEQGSLPAVLGGFACGAAFIAVLDRVVPHAHARFRERGHAGAEEMAAERRAVMLLAALTIHNLPEGMAVGVAFAAGGPELGVPLALAIGLQNIPEGFAAAAPLLGAGTPRRQAALVGLGTGLIEPVAAFGAYYAFGLSSALLPAGLAFAAAAMLYVVADELIPESQSHGNEQPAAVGLLVGFALMMALDAGLG